MNLTKIAIGNGAMGAEPEYEVIPAVSTHDLPVKLPFDIVVMYVAKSH